MARKPAKSNQGELANGSPNAGAGDNKAPATEPGAISTSELAVIPRQVLDSIIKHIHATVTPATSEAGYAAIRAIETFAIQFDSVATMKEPPK